MNTFESDEKYIAHTYARFPVEIVSGKGAELTDVNGKTYIDMGSGIAVNSFGTADEEWIEAVTAQMHRFQHTSNLFYSSPCAELAKLICERTGMKKAFFVNSGAESNECAIKLARAYGEQQRGKSCYKIICLENSFHGRTIATLSATGQDVFHSKFTPMLDGFVFAKANDFASVEALWDEDVCAIWMETIQGEGGVNVLDDDFVKSCFDFAQKKDILFMVDEVQTGNGRTGKLYSWMHYGIKPDVFTTAKGLGGGLPIGACIMGEKAENLFAPGDNGSTFGGNPVVCAGAVNIFSRLTDELIDEVAKKGEYIKEKLLASGKVKSVSGRGLMLGVLPKDKTNKEVMAAAREEGLLLLSAKDKIRLLPPLTISYEQLDKAISIMVKCM